MRKTREIKGKSEGKDYQESIRFIKSLLIVTSLQKKSDLKISKQIEKTNIPLSWAELDGLMIDKDVWFYAVEKKKYNPKNVFCHPDMLMKIPAASLYYRGLSGLSLKAIKDYCGSVEKLEKSSSNISLRPSKALQMARTYNTFICSIIKNSSKWTIENGKRTIIATLGITIDGIMRNKIGDIAEQRIRMLLVQWLVENDLIVEPKIDKRKIPDELPVNFKLQGEIIMKFASEPDISFYKTEGEKRDLKAIIEIKGGTDPAGALERYGAAQKSFRHARTVNPKCINFFLSAVYTPELEKRIHDDNLVEKYFDLVRILKDIDERKRFFKEIFHFSLRMI